MTSPARIKTRYTLTTTLTLCALVASSSGCDNASNTGPQLDTATSSLSRDLTVELSPEEQGSFAEDNATLSLNLFAEVADTSNDDNVLVSPLSVSLALAMTYAGAEGETEDQMAEALEFKLDEEALHPAFNWLDQQLASRGEDVEASEDQPFQLKVANSIWAEQTYAFNLDFLDTLALNYGAGLQLLDFINDPDGSREIINSWVEDKTETRIKDLLPQLSIKPSTRLVLTNAVYFNAVWDQPFEVGMTQEETFTTLSGETVTASMMRQTERFRYHRDEDFSAIEMDYAGKEVSMLAIVPDAGQYDAVAGRLDVGLLDQITEQLEPQEVDLKLPRFEFEATVDVVDPLKAFGMVDAFIEGQADFSGMDGTRDLFISGIFHKTFIKLDESGTEAAAATAVVIGIESAMPMPAEALHIDRPFIFAIRDNATGTILFIGRIADPTP